MKGLSFWVVSGSYLCRAQARACSAVKWNKPCCLFLNSGLNSYIKVPTLPLCHLNSSLCFPFLHLPLLTSYLSFYITVCYSAMEATLCPDLTPPLISTSQILSHVPMVMYFLCVSSGRPLGLSILRVEFCFQDKGVITVSMENQPYPTGRHLT